MGNILILGAGTMGNGIAQVFAFNNYTVYLYDISETALDKGINNIKKSLSKLLEKQKITQAQFDTTLNNLFKTLDFNELNKNFELIVEAVPENLKLKTETIQRLNNIVNENTIFATNTSSISITQLASSYKYPANFIGMHFMNPVPLMSLVEVIRGLQTSDQTFNNTIELVKKIGKTPCLSNDYPGFISNRVLMPMINEAIFCLYENISTRDNIDTIMKLGMNHPMGPLTLADFIGLDVCLNIMNVLYEGFKDPKYRPCPLLVKMVEAGKLGRKTGEGFYKY